MAEVVYLLCALSSVGCALLLARGFLRTRQRLLLWSALGFTGLVLNNVVLVVDLMLMSDIDLSVLRIGCATAGLLVMVLGFIAEASW